MCDAPLDKLKEWKGWIEIPEPPAMGGGGAWIDLSYPLSQSLSRTPSFPEPRFERLHSMPQDPANLTEIQMVCHFGTHLDAPLHFITEAPAMDEVPLTRLYGPGVVLAVEAGDDMLVTAEILDAATPGVEPGDIVIVDSGWSAHVNTERYLTHPSLSPDAAEWLVDRRAKMLAVDTLTPDLPSIMRPEGFTWPVHHTLLGQGVLVAELVRPAPELRGRRVEVMVLALNVAGSDGAPARIVARPAG
ncbi:MAG: cyclase family protein [Alphaproteobacteria bacterium]|nr:cyclase family protein [Alphaproteobacteria bacterium]